MHELYELTVHMRHYLSKDHLLTKYPENAITFGICEMSVFMNSCSS